MRLSTLCGFHRDTEQILGYFCSVLLLLNYLFPFSKMPRTRKNRKRLRHSIPVTIAFSASFSRDAFSVFANFLSFSVPFMWQPIAESLAELAFRPRGFFFLRKWRIILPVGVHIANIISFLGFLKHFQNLTSQQLGYAVVMLYCYWEGIWLEDADLFNVNDNKFKHSFQVRFLAYNGD